LKISRIIKKSGSKMAPTYCWTFWSLGLFAKGLRHESPHKLPAKLLKSTPRRWAWGNGPQPNDGPQPRRPRRVAAGTARGAQYSPDWGVVNALSSAFSGPQTGPGRGSGWGRGSARGDAQDALNQGARLGYRGHTQGAPGCRSGL
jgi:hypothetical protein